MSNLSRRNFVGTAAAAPDCRTHRTARLCMRSSSTRQRDWKLSEFHRLVRGSARIKQVYDVIAIGGGKFLNNIKNSLNGLHLGFGYPADQIQVVAALHGPTNLMNYDDYVWREIP